ncbi:hypothetical protein [Vibrio cyclitrophicus]|uniref:hypothetical protein n=1 Tax=Vibrio cyclitrophicus TaxID=47951 RepID=UPI0011B7513D|nr:hypothetical protein [Vibrio cyclitrophicus]
MLGMNYVIPYAKHRTNTGSGAGVPLILKSKGLASGEGLCGDCFNLPIKQGGVWLKEAEMESMLTNTLAEIGNIQRKFIITRLNLGPKAVPDELFLNIFARHSLPSNVKLNGVWAKTLVPESPFVLSVIDLRGQKCEICLTEKVSLLLANQSGETAILSDSPYAKFPRCQYQTKILNADYDNDGRAAGRLLNFEQLQLSNAAALLIDESTKPERLQQVLHWCELYQINVRRLDARHKQ